MKTVYIFLASSKELEQDRKEFKDLLFEKNKLWKDDKKIFLELRNWEDFIDAMSGTRLQDEYNKAIESSDIFVMLFWTKVGPFTKEEFETAWASFKHKKKPLIYTYFKEAPPEGPVQASLQEFKNKLGGLGHFETNYRDTGKLLLHFNLQLDRIYATPEMLLKSKNELLNLIATGQLPEVFEELNKGFLGKNDMLNVLLSEYIYPPNNFNQLQFVMRMKVFVTQFWKH